MDKIPINFCEIEDLMGLKGIGERTAERILEYRKIERNLTPETLRQIPYLRVTQELIDSIDFTPYEGILAPGKLSSPYNKYGQDESSNQGGYRYTTDTQSKVETQERGYGRKQNWPEKGHQRYAPKSQGVPGSISFDGMGSWNAFFTKFTFFADEQQWTGNQRKLNLCYCLHGKASEYFTMLVERSPHMEYFDVVDCLKKRFSSSDLPESYRLEFSNLRQMSEESVQEWADRVTLVGSQAFAGMPEPHTQRELVLKFCQGCVDKDAGHYTMNSKPSTLDEAMKSLLWYKHTTRLMHGRPRTHQARRTAMGDVFFNEEESESELSLRNVSLRQASASETMKSDNVDLKKKVSATDNKVVSLDNKVSSIDNRVSSLENKMDEMLKSIDKLTFAVNKIASARPRSRSPRRDPAESLCFLCKEKGHFKKDCPHASKQVQFLEVEEGHDLNWQGLEQQANLQPRQDRA